MEHDRPPQTTEAQGAAEFLERMRDRFATVGSELQDAYKQSGGEGMRDMVDDLVYDIAFEDPRYAANARKLQDRRTKPEEAERISQEQQDLLGKIRRIVILESGLPTEELHDDIEQAQHAIALRLSEGEKIDLTDSDAILRKLGILREDEKGGATFTYPEGLFPNSVNEKMDYYLLSVEGHVAAADAVRDGDGSRLDLESADKARRYAHNRIAEDLHEILGFNKLEEGWTFEKTRKLVAKMRESKFIDRPTGESQLTAAALGRGLTALGVLAYLAERPSSKKT